MADTEKDEYWGRNAYGGYGDARDPNKPSGMQAETDRYAKMGADAANTPAYKANYDQYNQYMGASNDARGTQNNALGLIAQRAQGGTPSAAEIAGRTAQDQALASTIAAAGTARGGPMQTAAAMRSATGGLAVQNQGLTNTIQAGRANEIANAQDAYMQGAGAVRSGDFQGAGLGLQQTGQDIQNQQFQRSLNAQQQQNYEQQRQKVYEDQLNANQQAQQESDAAWTAKRGAQMQDEQNTWGKIKDVAGTVLGGVTGAIGGIFGSDERMKTGLQPLGMHMGSLSGLGQTGMSGDSSPTGSMAIKGGGMDVMGSLAKTNAINTQYVKNPGGGMMMSDERTKEAEKQVNATRKAGGYAKLDMSPIAPSLTDHGYTSDSDRKATANLHSAIERDTEGATPYAPSAPVDNDAEDRFGLANAQEAAHIREQHPAMQIDEKGNAKIVGRSPGEQAQMQHDEEQGTPGSRVGDAFMRISGNLLGGVYGGRTMPESSFDYAKYMPLRSSRDTAVSDARAKEEAYQAGVQHGVGLATGPDTDKEEPVVHPEVGISYKREPSEERGVRQMATLMTAPGAPIYTRLAGGDNPFRTPDAPIKFPRYEQQNPTHGQGEVWKPVDARGKRNADGTVTYAQFSDKADVGPAARAIELAQRPTVREPTNVTEKLGAAPKVETFPENFDMKMRDTITSDEHAKVVIEAEEPMRRANLAMEPSAYKYKPGFTPEGQDEGETNVGPMAQKMAADPVARTAIVQGHDGLLGIDKEKALKLALGSLASLQHQIDALVEAKHRRSA